MNDSQQLVSLLDQNREKLLSKWREQVRELPNARTLSIPTLNDHIPFLLDELAEAFKTQSDETIPTALANMSGYHHGLQRLKENFDIAEVVTEYNLLRGCIHDLATSKGINLQGKPFHILNRVLDGAIGLAVHTYATEQASVIRKQREEYLSFVAHDLRTPLNAISLAATYLERQNELSKGNATNLPSIYKTLKRNVGTMSSLVANIIKENESLISESEVKVQSRIFELWPFIEEIIQDLAPIAQANSCKMVNEVSFDISAFGDSRLLTRVLRNLIANAIKYTPNGQVKIGAKSVDDGSVVCWVSDTGAGIASERLLTIFKKFDTDPDRNDGVGLGLSIVESFVKAHGGEIKVESKEGVGSTFTIFLPGDSVAVAA